MQHLTPINQKARRIESTLENDVVALQQGGPPGRTAHSARLLVRLFAWMGGRQQRRHRRSLPAGRARSVRLPSHLLLAGARARSLQLRARLDREVRVGAEGLAQDRPDFPMSALSSRRAWLLHRGGRLRSPRPLAPRPVVGAAARPASRRAATARIYVGTYARNILVLDEATMRVRDTLRTSIGIPETARSRSTASISTSPIPATRRSRSSISRPSNRSAASRCRTTA